MHKSNECVLSLNIKNISACVLVVHILIKIVTKQKKQAVRIAVDFGREPEVILKETWVPNFYKSQADESNCVMCRDCHSLCEVGTTYHHICKTSLRSHVLILHTMTCNCLWDSLQTFCLSVLWVGFGFGLFFDIRTPGPILTGG